MKNTHCTFLRIKCLHKCKSGLKSCLCAGQGWPGGGLGENGQLLRQDGHQHPAQGSSPHHQQRRVHQVARGQKHPGPGQNLLINIIICFFAIAQQLG